jgi:hypothetical protein
MLTFGDLQKAPERVSELGNDHVLVAAATAREVVVHDKPKKPEATMVFQHETIAMMRAERAEQLGKLKAQLGASSIVVPIRKRDGSFWDAAQVTVGRAATADIVLSDPAVSNVHAHFELAGDERAVSVKDLGSSNGTFLNRQPLHPHKQTPLASGDCVRFGQTIFYFIANKSLCEMLASP